jgi:hypothetical protein
LKTVRSDHLELSSDPDCIASARPLLAEVDDPALQRSNREGTFARILAGPGSARVPTSRSM